METNAQTTSQKNKTVECLTCRVFEMNSHFRSCYKESNAENHPDVKNPLIKKKKNLWAGFWPKSMWTPGHHTPMRTFTKLHNC